MSASKNYEDLALGNPYDGVKEDSRVSYYRKRGIGKNVPIPGGMGISHYVYRVPKSEILTRNEVRKIEKDEYDAMMAAQAAEKAAANLVRKGEMNANVAGLVYTNEPTSSIDIDGPIHLESLAERGTALAVELLKKKNANAAKKSHMRMPKKTYSPNVDDAIAALREAFVETEKGKVYYSSHKEAEAKMPKNSSGHIVREYQGSVPRERDRLVQEHIDRKMPKIEAVLAKVREGMILGFPSPPPKVVPKEENLLRFEDLSSINFSAPAGSAAAGSGAPARNDPFDGWGGKRKARKTRKSRKSSKTRKGR